MGLDTEIVGGLADVTSTVNLPPEIISQLSLFITIMQALGGIFIIYLIFNIISAILNRKQQKELSKINQNLEEIKAILQKKGK